jgi:GT2 family glycosyltransferase
MTFEDNKLSIVIVNWNSGEFLSMAFSSLLKFHSFLIEHVIIIDNGSMDHSIDFLSGAGDFPFEITVVKNPNNIGFGAACNQGAKYVQTSLILFLNPDTQIHSNSISIPVKFMNDRQNSKVGICGIQLIDERGCQSTSAARFPTLRVMLGEVLRLNKVLPRIFPPHLMNAVELKKGCSVDQIIGAFFCIRKTVFDDCQGFDERFFVYFEEVDLSLRAKKNGFESYFLSEGSAFHKGGGCSDKVKSTRLFYSLRSRILYAQKHYSSIELAVLILLTGIELPLRLIQSLVAMSWSDIKNTFVAYFNLIIYFLRRVCGHNR